MNGKRLVVKGVNRHCFYPETGRTTSKRLDIEDVKLVKGMNANAIRSHYQNGGLGWLFPSVCLMTEMCL